MKKWSLVLGSMLVLIISTNCFAVEVEGDAYVGVYSKYLSKGFDYSGGKAVLQGGMDLSAYGFTFGVWSNMQLQDGFDSDGELIKGGEINETDFTIDYTFSLGEITSVSLGNYHYTYNDPESENEAYVGVAFDLLLAPEFYISYGWDLPGTDEGVGLFYKLSGSHALELNEETALTLGALVTYNQESYFAGDYTAFHNYELTAALDFTLNDNWSLTAKGLYSDALSTDAEDAGVDSEFVGSFDITFAY